MYSASVEDVETAVGCLMKEMKFTSAAPLMRTRLPEKDFLSDRSPAQSESAMMVMVEEEVSLLRRRFVVQLEDEWHIDGGLKVP